MSPTPVVRLVQGPPVSRLTRLKWYVQSEWPVAAMGGLLGALWGLWITLLLRIA